MLDGIDQGGAKRIVFLKICDEGQLLLIGSINDFEVHEIKDNSKTKKIFSCRSPKVFTAERLPGTHLVAFVSTDSPYDLEVYNISRNTTLCTRTYSQPITVVKASGGYVVVGMQDRLLVHTAGDLRLFRELSHLCGWIEGVLAISKKGNQIAFPDIRSRASVRMCNIESDAVGVSFHTEVRKPIRLLSFNENGSLLAVAHLENYSFFIYNNVGDKVFHLRRSVMIPVPIQSIEFSGNSRLVAVTSNTESVHIFNLNQKLVPNTFAEKLKGLALNDSQPPIKTFQLKSLTGFNSVCTFKPKQGQVGHVIVATKDGKLETFEVKDLEDDHQQWHGGESSRRMSESSGFKIDPRPLYEGYEQGPVLDSRACALRRNNSKSQVVIHTTEL